MKQYDAIVIGAGQAGVPLAKKLAGQGKKTALIEKRYVGGTCVNDGCTPTKAMVASAKAAYNAAHSAELGVLTGPFTVDLKKIKERKDKIVMQSRTGGQKAVEKTEGLDLIFGEATFTGNKVLSVTLNDGGNLELTADLIFVNTGASPAIPDIDGLEDAGYLTSTTILDLEEVPQHLLIIGGNYIGLEFGQMFRRFGSKVTILERSGRLLPREDEDIATELTSILQKEDINIMCSSHAKKFIKTGFNITAEIETAKGIQRTDCSHILVAAGRKPQTANLGLDKTGVEVDEKGYIKVNNKLETNVPGIYALGDVKPGPAFTHISYNDYTIVYRNLFEGENFTTDDRPIPYCMFTDPQLGRIGITESEAEKQGLDYLVAKLPMAHVARAIEVGDTRGIMKAIIDPKSKRILGAAILGQEGGEIMSVLQMAIEGNITYDRIRYCVFAHPTYSESLNNLFMKIEQ